MDKAELATEIIDRALRLSRLPQLKVGRGIVVNDGFREFKVGNWYFRIIFYDPQHPFEPSDVKILVVQRNVNFNYFNTTPDGRPFCLNKESNKNGETLWIRQDTCEKELLPFLRNYMVLQDMADIV